VTRCPISKTLWYRVTSRALAKGVDANSCEGLRQDGPEETSPRLIGALSLCGKRASRNYSKHSGHLVVAVPICLLLGELADNRKFEYLALVAPHYAEKPDRHFSQAQQRPKQ